MATHRKPTKAVDLEKAAAEQVEGLSPISVEHEANTIQTHRELVANTNRTQSTPVENTERTHREYADYKPTELETFSIRLDPNDKKRLQAYFKRRGLSLSQGLRVWIIERMELERMER
jgi:hypothetical protein